KTDDRDLRDPGMVGERSLDLDRGDRLPTGADDLAEAPDNPDVSLRVDRGDVAGMVPAVAQSLASGIGIVEVAAHQKLAPDAELAGVRGAELDPEGGEPDRPRLPEDVLVGQDRGRTALGRSVVD